MIGYRYSDEPKTTGEKLPPSYAWDGDERTDRQLRGTCAFEALASCQRYAQWSHGYILTLDGEQVGTDEDLPGGIILSDPVVIGVARWR